MDISIYIISLLSLSHAVKGNLIEIFFLVLCFFAVTEYCMSIMLDLQCVEVEENMQTRPFTVKLSKCLSLSHILSCIPCEFVRCTLANVVTEIRCISAIRGWKLQQV